MSFCFWDESREWRLGSRSWVQDFLGWPQWWKGSHWIFLKLLGGMCLGGGMWGVCGICGHRLICLLLLILLLFWSCGAPVLCMGICSLCSWLVWVVGRGCGVWWGGGGGSQVNFLSYYCRCFSDLPYVQIFVLSLVVVFLVLIIFTSSRKQKDILRCCLISLMARPLITGF